MMSEDILPIFCKDYVLNGCTMSIHLAGCNEKIKGNCGYITVEKYVVYIINKIDGNLVTFNEFRKDDFERAISLYERLIAISVSTNEKEG
ncbi:hypothetical protein N5C89_32970 [Klebsiella michiganensis]|uniref:Uncharacterized protein n=1 Tax=Klebsiella michiganensis TaxID=1134687 RepID=A0AAJ1NYC7_9ENTR|nr:hypothetical protein [Klebsiella michiganensis]MDH0967636.1 hypothetical protein [Klebsiella michiganensis]